MHPSFQTDYDSCNSTSFSNSLSSKCHLIEKGGSGKPWQNVLPNRHFACLMLMAHFTGHQWIDLLQIVWLVSFCVDLLLSQGLEAYFVKCFNLSFVELALSPSEVNGLFNGKPVNWFVLRIGWLVFIWMVRCHWVFWSLFCSFVFKVFYRISS